MWSGRGTSRVLLPSAGRERGVSLRGARGGRSLRRDREDGKAVIWAFLGRHGEPRKRPGPDVIGHQLTVLRARAPPAAAAVAVAEVAAPAAPPPAAGLGLAAGALALRAPPLEPLRSPAWARTPRARLAAPGSAPSVPEALSASARRSAAGGKPGLPRAAGGARPAFSSSTSPTSRGGA